ncbi:MAG: LysR family transcriptional regulator [Lachnospiraceae bacterium]|nr:LysR family transcriptional regulator [Lachnospiraceae bacterium]
MDVEKARALICVIEEKSISAAADKMGYTPSGISRMMAALEDDLGFQLLIRRKEGISVTAECRQMLPVIRDYIRSDEECIQMAARIRGMEVGTVTIGSAYSEYYRWLAECVKSFHEKYPGIRMELSSGYSSDLIQKVLNHKLDIAIVSRRDEVDEWLPLRKDPMVAWVPVNHRLAGLKGVPIEEFAKENYIDSNPEYVTDNALILEKYGISPNIQLQSKDSHASWQMVEAGLGIGLNNYINSKDRIGEVKVLPLIPEQTVEIGITYSRDMTLAGRIFMEQLKNDYIRKTIF